MMLRHLAPCLPSGAWGRWLLTCKYHLLDEKLRLLIPPFGIGLVQAKVLGLDNTVLSFKYTPLITSAGFAFAICGRSYLGRVSPPLPR